MMTIFCNILQLSCSTNVTSNSKKFCFCWQYIHNMMNSFDNFIFFLYMYNWSSNIVFDAHIGYDKYSILINRWILVDVFKFVLISDFYISIFWLTQWKEKQLGKESTRWKLEDNSLFKLSKARNISCLCLLWDF